MGAGGLFSGSYAGVLTGVYLRRKICNVCNDLRRGSSRGSLKGAVRLSSSQPEVRMRAYVPLGGDIGFFMDDT